jgi:hypothetical protein
MHWSFALAQCGGKLAKCNAANNPSKKICILSIFIWDEIGAANNPSGKICILSIFIWDEIGAANNPSGKYAF